MNSQNRSASDLMDSEINRKLEYDTAEIAAVVTRNVPLITHEPKIIYDFIMLAVSTRQGGFIFLDAPGRTEKTILISLIHTEIDQTMSYIIHRYNITHNILNFYIHLNTIEINRIKIVIPINV